jgi:hypothetical protein
MRTLNHVCSWGIAACLLAFGSASAHQLAEADAIAIGVSNLKKAIPLREYEAEAHLLQASQESLSPIGVRDADPIRYRAWVESLTGRFIWNVRVCPLEKEGKRRRLWCAQSYIDADTGQDVSFE